MTTSALTQPVATPSTEHKGPPPKLLTKPDVMSLLGVSDRTLEKLVSGRKFPPPLRLGKTVRWPEPKVHEWLARELEPVLNWQPPKRAARTGAKSA